MAEHKLSQRVVFRCPVCFNRLIDVTLDKDSEGIYRCMKCGYNGNHDDLMEKYQNFRERYRLAEKRITLEEQRKL